MFRTFSFEMHINARTKVTFTFQISGPSCDLDLDPVTQDGCDLKKYKPTMFLFIAHK